MAALSGGGRDKRAGGEQAHPWGQQEGKEKQR